MTSSSVSTLQIFVSSLFCYPVCLSDSDGLTFVRKMSLRFQGNCVGRKECYFMGLVSTRCVCHLLKQLYLAVEFGDMISILFRVI